MKKFILAAAGFVPRLSTQLEYKKRDIARRALLYLVIGICGTVALIALQVKFADASESYPSCTMHGGIVLCFLTPAPMAVADAVCERAMRAQVIAQEYASANPDKPEVIAKIMGAASDNLFKQCAWPAPRAVTAPAAFKPAG